MQVLDRVERCVWGLVVFVVLGLLGTMIQRAVDVGQIKATLQRIEGKLR